MDHCTFWELRADKAICAADGAQRSLWIWLLYLAEGLHLVGMGGVPGLPERQSAQTVLYELAAKPQCLCMHLHNGSTLFPAPLSQDKGSTHKSHIDLLLVGSIQIAEQCTTTDIIRVL